MHGELTQGGKRLVAARVGLARWPGWFAVGGKASVASLPPLQTTPAREIRGQIYLIVYAHEEAREMVQSCVQPQTEQNTGIDCCASRSRASGFESVEQSLDVELLDPHPYSPTW